MHAHSTWGSWLVQCFWVRFQLEIGVAVRGVSVEMNGLSLMAYIPIQK